MNVSTVLDWGAHPPLGVVFGTLAEQLLPAFKGLHSKLKVAADGDVRDEGKSTCRVVAYNELIRDSLPRLLRIVDGRWTVGCAWRLVRRQAGKCEWLLN